MMVEAMVVALTASAYGPQGPIWQTSHSPVTPVMDARPAQSDPLQLVANLEAAQAIETKDATQWTGVANIARVMADSLRIRDGPGAFLLMVLEPC